MHSHAHAVLVGDPLRAEGLVSRHEPRRLLQATGLELQHHGGGGLVPEADVSVGLVGAHAKQGGDVVPVWARSRGKRGGSDEGAVKKTVTEL